VSDLRRLRLDDLEEIRTLQASYCRLVDSGYESAPEDADAFAALFSEDGVWAAGPEPVVGREAIRQRASSSRRFRFHVVANPVVHVEGDRATGWWHVLVAVTGAEGAAWLAGRYEDEFVRTADGWRFVSVRFHRALHAPYYTGWAPQ
jgi:ketosteroid isomerase-like protein